MVTEIGYNGLVLKTCVSANEPTWGFESLTLRLNPLGWPESSGTAPCACLHEERYINEYGPLGDLVDSSGYKPPIVFGAME